MGRTAYEGTAANFPANSLALVSSTAAGNGVLELKYRRRR
jgi:hypothetical protein